MESMQALIGTLAARTAARVKEAPGDYVAGGFLHCGKCGKPKERNIEINGHTFKVRELCACEAAALEARKKEEEKRERQQRADERRAMGFTDPALNACRFEAAERTEAGEVGRRYVEHFATFKEKGKGLLLYGGVGTGKTYTAACIANAIIDAGGTAMVTSVITLAAAMQADPAAKAKTLRDLRLFDLLVLDDFGAERKTEYMNEIVFAIIDARSRSGLPLIVTTNTPLEALKNPLSVTEARIFDRVLQMCHPVEVKGGNKRREQIRASYAEDCRLLGL